MLCPQEVDPLHGTYALCNLSGDSEEHTGAESQEVNLRKPVSYLDFPVANTQSAL